MADDFQFDVFLSHSEKDVFCMSANAIGSDWAQLAIGTFRFRDPLNQQCRFSPPRLDDAPIKGSLAPFHYSNWLPQDREQEPSNAIFRFYRPPINSI